MARTCRIRLGAALVASAFIAIAAWAPPARAAFDLQVVAYSGGPAPGLPGAVIDSLFPDATPPVLNESGQLVFVGTLETGPGGVSDANDSALWASGPDNVPVLLAREGDGIPGAPQGIDFGPFWNSTDVSFALSDSGRVAAMNARALLVSHEDGTLELLAMSGALLSGAPPPYDLEPLDGPGTYALDPLGRIVFTADYPNWATGVFVWDEVGGASPIVFTGDPAPGLPGSTYLTLSGPAFADAAHIAHHADLLTGIWYEPTIWTTDAGSDARLIARLYDPVPGAAAGVTYAAFSPVASNVAGDLVVHVSLAGGAACSRTPMCTGVVRVRGEAQPELVAMSGDAASGAAPDKVFHWIFEPVINRSGQVAFSAAFMDAPGSLGAPYSWGIWGPDADSVSLRAFEGGPVAGLPGATYDGLAPVSLNDRGELAFQASLTHEGERQGAIVFVRVNGNAERVIRTGQLLEVAPGDVREVYSLRFAEAHYAARPRLPLNSRGQVVFAVEFSDGSSAVVLATLRRSWACGLGAELVLLAPLVAWFQRKRPRRPA